VARIEREVGADGEEDDPARFAQHAAQPGLARALGGYSDGGSSRLMMVIAFDSIEMKPRSVRSLRMRFTISREAPTMLARSCCESFSPTTACRCVHRELEQRARHAPVDVHEGERADLAVGLAHALREDLHHHVGDARRLLDAALERGMREHQERRRLDGGDRGRARLLVDHRHLAEEVAGPRIFRMISRPSSSPMNTFTLPDWIM
jgi:hypothetical protein